MSEAKNASTDEVVKLREKVAELEKGMEHLNYAISHDLRAPLRAVQGFSIALIEDYGSKLDGEAQRYLNIVAESAQRLSQMIDAILTLSRLGRQGVQVSEVNMQSLVRELVAEQEKKVGDRKVEFHIGELPSVNGDLGLLKLVWTHLLSNAVKFTAEKPTAVIEIGSQMEAQQKIFFVRDNGVGFDMQYVSKLFALFQRLHHDKNFPGVGVGLALVELAIRKHEGRVWAEGKSGEGAIFYFSLPA